MADNLLPVMVGILGSAVLAGMTLAVAYALRRVHEVRDRILVLETRMDGLAGLEDLLDKHGLDNLARALGGGRRAR